MLFDNDPLMQMAVYTLLNQPRCHCLKVLLLGMGLLTLRDENEITCLLFVGHCPFADFYSDRIMFCVENDVGKKLCLTKCTVAVAFFVYFLCNFFRNYAVVCINTGV